MLGIWLSLFCTNGFDICWMWKMQLQVSLMPALVLVKFFGFSSSFSLLLIDGEWTSAWSLLWYQQKGAEDLFWNKITILQCRYWIGFPDVVPLTKTSFSLFLYSKYVFLASLELMLHSLNLSTLTLHWSVVCGCLTNTTTISTSATITTTTTT